MESDGLGLHSTQAMKTCTCDICASSSSHTGPERRGSVARMELMLPVRERKAMMTIATRAGTAAREMKKEAQVMIVTITIGNTT